MDGITLGMLAHEAGFENLDVMAALKLFQFGKLVAEAEREACAKVCEHLRVAHGNGDPDGDECAAAIRMRSNV